MIHRAFLLPFACLLLAACQTTTTEQSAAEPSSTAGASAATVAAKDATPSEDILVSEFRYTGADGSAGELVVEGDSVTYRDEYCGGMTNSTGMLEGSKIEFDRMTYPACGKPEPLWADIVVRGFDRATGCFEELRFTWGYDYIERYYAYPTDPKCKAG